MKAALVENNQKMIQKKIIVLMKNLVLTIFMIVFI